MKKTMLLAVVVLAACKQAQSGEMIDGSIRFQVEGMRRINGSL